jgi:hypothetical protein
MKNNINLMYDIAVDVVTAVGATILTIKLIEMIARF